LEQVMLVSLVTCKCPLERSDWCRSGFYTAFLLAKSDWTNYMNNGREGLNEGCAHMGKASLNSSLMSLV